MRAVPKRHHYVPEVLLKRFVDADGWLHFYSRIEPTGRIRRTRPDNAFLEGHLYSEIDEAGRHDPAVEFELAKLEGQVEPVIEKLVSGAASGQLPRLTEQERSTWDTFFVVQWKRVPDLHLTVTTDDEVRAYFKQIREDLKLHVPARSAEIDAFGHPEAEKRFLKNARVKSVLGASDRVMRALQTRGIALLRIRAFGKGLIIGSRPVLQMNFRGGLSLFDEPTEMWLPVASDLAVGVGRRDLKEVIYDLSDHHSIRRLNLAIANQSTAIASRSAALTRSIADARTP